MTNETVNSWVVLDLSLTNPTTTIWDSGTTTWDNGTTAWDMLPTPADQWTEESNPS